MSWRNIRLIYAREIRDQLRDRRTLFMIAVLPLLLYPLLGMSVFQLSQFLRKSEPKVVVVGADELKAGKELPPLIEGDHFAATLFNDGTAADWLHLEFAKGSAGDAKSAKHDSPAEAEIASKADHVPLSDFELAEARLKTGDVQVVLTFPKGFGKRLNELHTDIKARANSPNDKSAAKAANNIEFPTPRIIFNAGKEKSRVAHMQVERVIEAWRAQIVRRNLAESRVPAQVTKPFEFEMTDVAERNQQQALLWSKILPFVLFIWALTGAFYPAVDLCAGEKERGTLETLLSSPARRIEIVWGKLLTVMTFSTATAVLNLTSLGFTAHYVVSQLSQLPTADVGEGLALPPISSALWLLAALLPMSALFSALCLACAAFARSTKEGQYYLMPLLLISMPLMMLPMAPGTELNLGNSLIPITGVVLLVMALVQGDFADALRYCVPVCGVTLICCHLAIRWAVYQFNQESVLFRESERLDPRRWLVHLIRDREDTPSLAEGFVCVVLIFVIKFFMEVSMAANAPAEKTFNYLVTIVFVSQVVCIAVPAVLMAMMLTGRPLKTLLLNRLPSLAACGVAVLLAACIHPLGVLLAGWIQILYPVQEQVKNELVSFDSLLKTAPYAWMPYALLAALPAVCEELAFRGFILSGLRHLGSKRWAIGLSAVFFGMAHGVIQQSISATALGVVIGYVAVQTGSLLPGMLFHVTYNSLMFAGPTILARFTPQHTAAVLPYSWPVFAVAGVGAVLLLLWFHRLPYQATREEQIGDAQARQQHHPLTATASTRAD
jgi:sodium transport system permease protein